MIKFDGNYGSNIGTLGYISNYKLNDSEITHVGYFDPNRGKGKDLTDMYSTSCKGIFSEDSYMATTYASIQDGMSGGPVVIYKNSIPYVVGINSRGGTKTTGFWFFEKTGTISTLTKITESVNQAIHFLEMND